jgi:hypothetical protein
VGKSSPPPAPDYVGAAQATAAGNLQNLQYQTQANRVNSSTPFGSQQWTQGTDVYGRPNNQWTQTTTLNPAEQAALTSQQNVQQNQGALAQTLQGQVAQQMAGGFNAPNVNDYLSGVPSIQEGFTGFNGAGPQTNTQQYNFNQNQPQANTNFSGISTANEPQLNLNTPQFSDATAQAGAQAAYQGQVGLLQPQFTQDTTNLDAQLRLQGLTPGSEAYNNSMQNLQRTQGQQLDQIANQSVLTGNTEANQNYASALQGYNANVNAQGQAFNQGLSANQSQQQALENSNTAVGQNFGQNLSGFNTNLASQQAYNAAQAQNYGQALGNYGTQQSALENQNNAAQQALQQQTDLYNTQYQAAFNQYQTPLNSLNAVLNGQQVQSPQFPGLPNSTSGYVPGADLTTAAQNQGQYNSGLYATQQGAQNSALGSAAMIAAAYFI